MPITLQPLDAAVEYLRRKTPVTSALRFDGWARVALALRERAQFSAGVESVRMMSFIQQSLDDILSNRRNQHGVLTDRAKFVRDMMEMARGEGLPSLGPKGSIADIHSSARANLIYRQQTSSAYGYASWQAGQDLDALEAAPAQELVRLEERRMKRNWHERWRAAGGTIYPGSGLDGREGRLVALKTDPVWSNLSRFGTPWPPYDFNSGVWVEDVLLDEAIDLGVIPSTAPPPAPVLEDFNRGLTADLSDIGQEGRDWLIDQFGDQVEIGRHEARWQGSIIQDRVRAVLDGDVSGASLRLGAASPRAVALASERGLDLRGKSLILSPTEIRKTWRDHGPSESRPGQAPLTPLDYELIPHVWRAPDAVTRGDRPGAWMFRKDIIGRLVTVGWETQGSTIQVKTIYKKSPPTRTA